MKGRRPAISFSCDAPASACTHGLFHGPSLSWGETYWLRHSGKPRASLASSPVRFQFAYTDSSYSMSGGDR